MGYSEEAKAAGRAAYKACRDAGGTFKEAQRARRKAAYRTDPEYERAAARQWVKNNRDRSRAGCRRGHARRAGHAPPDPDGPTLSELIAAQEGRCAICTRELEGAHPSLDHDHTTGKIRAALCGKCNRGLGCFDENIAALMTAASYVIQHKNA